MVKVSMKSFGKTDFLNPPPFPTLDLRYFHHDSTYRATHIDHFHINFDTYTNRAI